MGGGRRSGAWTAARLLSGCSVSKDEVDTWISTVNALAVKSIICLFVEDQLPYDGEYETDLLLYYRAAGLDGVNVRSVSPARPHVPSPERRRRGDVQQRQSV
jgi:hypothetical protein